MSLWARRKRPVQDGAVVLIQASGGTELRCQHAVARQLTPGPGQKRCNRVSTMSLAHMAPPVDHFQVRRGAQLLVPVLDDAVLKPGLSRRQAEEDIVVYPELGADPEPLGVVAPPEAEPLGADERSYALAARASISSVRGRPHHPSAWQRAYGRPITQTAGTG